MSLMGLGRVKTPWRNRALGEGRNGNSRRLLLRSPAPGGEAINFA